MLSDLLFAIRRFRWDQLKYFRHASSPFSPWRSEIAAVVQTTSAEAAHYGIKTPVDRRRAYQVARMVVSNRRGEHLVDLVPDAYQAFSPPSAATLHAGRRKYPPPAERRAAFLRHPQTLAYLLTPPALARLGVGASVPGSVGPIAAGEQGVSLETLMQRFQSAMSGKGRGGDLRAYAEVLLRLDAGIPTADVEEAAAA